MSTNWYCRLEGIVSGPFSSEELKYLVSRGKLSRNNVVRQGESGQWVAASSLGELFPVVVARKPTIVTPAISPTPESPVESRPDPRLSAREAIDDDTSAEQPVPAPPSPPPTTVTRERASQQRTTVWIGLGIGVALLLLMLLFFLLLYSGSRSVAQRWADNPGNQLGGGEGRAGSGAAVGPQSNEGATEGPPLDSNDGSESDSDEEPANPPPQDVPDELSAEPVDPESDTEMVEADSSDMNETGDAALEDMPEMEVEEDLPGFSIRPFEPPPPEAEPEERVSRESNRQPNRRGGKTKWGEKPVAGCRAHFTGGLIADRQVGGTFTQVYVEDSMSEYVGAGRYPSNEEAFPKAIAASFDGIAIDKGTKVTIYRKPNFQGGVIYERSGPAIVNNRKWSGNRVWAEIIMGRWRPDLQETYPPKSRHWSQTDMHVWRHGSMIIECVR